MLFQYEAIFIIFCFLESGRCLQCYECVSDIEFGSQDTCKLGKTWFMRRAQCRVPSVCATYSVTSLNHGRPSITSVVRGCQAIADGPTCEEIFNDARSRELFPEGHHQCSTCSTDFCNSSKCIRFSFYFLSVSISVLFIVNYVTMNFGRR